MSDPFCRGPSLRVLRTKGGRHLFLSSKTRIEIRDLSQVSHRGSHRAAGEIDRPQPTMGPKMVGVLLLGRLGSRADSGDDDARRDDDARELRRAP